MPNYRVKWVHFNVGKQNAHNGLAETKIKHRKFPHRI